MPFERVSVERQSPFVQNYQTPRLDEVARQAVKTFFGKWMTIKPTDAFNSVERMYFKRDLVDNCKRMKTKLKTEASFQRPATKSVTIQSVKDQSPRMKITWDRPKLLYSLIAPPVLRTESLEYEEREVPTVPEKVLKMPLTFILRINHLKWEVKDFEKLYGSIAIYDMKEKRKVTENFNFQFGSSDKIFPIFNLEENKDEYVILLRIEKCLQSDQHDPIEAYQKDIPDVKREKIRLSAKNNESLLSQYRMQFAWTFVAFAGLKRGRFVSESRRKSNESSDTGTYSVFESDRTSQGSFSIEDDSGNDFIPPNGAIDFSIKQVYKTDNEKLSDDQICWHIVDVCKNPQKYKQRTVNCEFSISLMSPGDLHNIRNDDGQKLKPWRPDLSQTVGRMVREFPVEGRVPRPLVSYRNILYVFPTAINFSNHQRARNIAVQIELRNECETIPAIFGDDCTMKNHHLSSVTYHRSQPTFLDEIKVEIPSELTPDHHLFFTFSHISVKEGRELPVGYTWLPLMNANQHLKNQQACLPVCSHPPPTGYGRINPDSNLPGVKWLENRKSLFKVSILIDSNVHIEDRNVHYFLKCVLAAEKVQHGDTFSNVAGRRMPIEQLQEDLMCSIRALAQSATMPSIVKHLHTILNRLVWLIVSPPLNERIVIAQAAFNTLVSIVNRIHGDSGLRKDIQGRNRYLEQYIYYVLREGVTEDAYDQNTATLGRKDWIRHTMIARRQNKNTLNRHSSYSNTMSSLRMNPSASDPDLTPKKSTTMKPSPSVVESQRDDVRRPLYEELAFQMVVCSNSSKEKVLADIWFFFEFITKSVTEHYLLSGEKSSISERLFEYLGSIVAWVTQEITKKCFEQFDLAQKINSALSFFLRDLLELLSKSQLLELIRQYDSITKEVLASGDHSGCHHTLRAMNLLRARFYRLIVFHGSYFEVIGNGATSDDPLSVIMSDISRILSEKLNVDINSLNFNLSTLMKVQSAVDADNRYDSQGESIASFFLPFVKSTLCHLQLISEANNANKLPISSSHILLIVNLWVVRKICSAAEIFSDFVHSFDKKDLIFFNQMLLAMTTLFKYNPESVLERNRHDSASKKNIEKLDQLNKGAGSAVHLLKSQTASIGRSTESESSFRSWKQIRTRGLTATASGRATSDSVLFEDDRQQIGMSIDLDSSSEIYHSVIDILEQVFNLKVLEEGDYWHRSYCQVIVDLLTSPSASVCTLTRTMKVLRNQLQVYLPCLIYTPLLSSICIRISNLLTSGNLEVSKSAQLTMMKILSDHYSRFLSVSLPSFWLKVGVCHMLGLRRYQSFSELRHVNAGNLYFHLHELIANGYSQNDSAEFRTLYQNFVGKTLSLVESVDHFISLKAKNISSNFILLQIGNLLESSPLSRIDVLTALAEEQKEINPVEAGFCYLHKAAIITEILRYAPSPDSSNVPKSAALLGRELKVKSLEQEAFVSDWINRSIDSAITAPVRLELSIGHVTAALFAQERDARISLEGFQQSIESAATYFSKGKISELSAACYQILMRINGNDMAIMRSVTEKLLESQREAIEQDDRYGDERFGCYFRVHYHGANFPAEIVNRDFVFREAMASKLSEVSERIRKDAAALCDQEVELVMESSTPLGSQHSVQVTFLKVLRRDWEEKNQNWLDHINLTNFVFATPFTSTGEAHGDVKVQFKRKTYLQVKNRMPYHLGQVPVTRTWTEELNPLQVAKEDIETKTLALYESLKSNDTRIIQLQLQGSIQATVNQGPLHLARELLGKKPTENGEIVNWEDLRDAFINFMHICRCAISRNKELMSNSRTEYHHNLEQNFAQIQNDLRPFISI